MAMNMDEDMSVGIFEPVDRDELRRDFNGINQRSPSSQREVSPVFVQQPHETTSQHPSGERATQTGTSRELESESDTFLNINRDGLSRSFKCLKCSRFLSSPVRTCVNGHFICSTCYDRDRWLRCRYCWGGFLVTPVREMEFMLENFSLPCMYKNDGCTLILRASERTSHAKECMYRPIKCDAKCQPMTCLNKLIKFRNYRNHMLQTHDLSHFDIGETKIIAVMFEQDDITFNGGLWPLESFSLDGNTFLLRNFLKNKDFITWCTIIGTENDAKKYRVNISLVAHLDEDDESLYESMVQKNLPIYSSHVQNLVDFTNAEVSPFRISLSSLERKKFISRYGNPEEEACYTGNGPYKYRWNVFYTFFEVQDGLS